METFVILPISRNDLTSQHIYLRANVEIVHVWSLHLCEKINLLLTFLSPAAL